MAFLVLVLLMLIVLASIKGFRDSGYFEKYLFYVDPILRDKEYYRLFSSGFLHLNWMHLIGNMVGLYFFGSELAVDYGTANFFALYFVSLIGGSLLSLYFHRMHGDYRAVGASGAVSGILYAYILLNPHAQLGLVVIPGIHFPAWVFGIGYMLFTLYGVKAKHDNIGHDAHLGGALTGLLLAALMFPTTLLDNYWIFLALLVPSAIFLYLVVTKPEIMLIDNYTKFRMRRVKEQVRQERTMSQQEEIDRILDKVSAKGLNSLSERDKKILKKYSQK